MAGSVTNLVTFGTQLGPISLSNLDTNFSALQSAVNSTNNQSNYYGDSSVVANQINVTVPYPQTFSLTVGLQFYIRVGQTNTGATAISVNATGNVQLLNQDGSALSAGQILSGSIIDVVYNGTNWLLVNNSLNPSSLYVSPSGAVGVGTTSPTTRLDVNGAIKTNYGLMVTDGSTTSTIFQSPYALVFHADSDTSAGDFIFINSNLATERMRLTSGGTLLIGTSSTGGQGLSLVPQGGGSNTCLEAVWNGTATSGNVPAQFRYNGTAVGQISYNTTTTTYAVSSDYRLKTNPQPLTNSGAFIDALQPKEWTWTVNGQRGVGLIAHEVQAVSPDSVIGDKDAVDADGNAVYQSMSYSSSEFIANIIAELKSLRARVAELESKV